MPLTLLVNGAEHQVDVPSDAKLLYVLRDNLGLTGTKYGCGEGGCAALAPYCWTVNRRVPVRRL